MTNNNKELKQEKAKKIIAKYKKLGIETLRIEGLDDNSEYFHPIFKIKDDYCFYSQVGGTGEDLRAYGFDIFKDSEDFRCDAYVSDSTLEKVYKNMDYYFPRIKARYEKALSVRNIINNINKKLQEQIIDIDAMQDKEIELNEYLEVQKLVNEIYEMEG